MLLNKGGMSGAPKLPKICFLTIKTTFPAKKNIKITIFLFKKYQRYLILKIQYSRLFETVKGFETSAFKNIDNLYSQA